MDEYARLSEAFRDADKSIYIGMREVSVGFAVDPHALASKVWPKGSHGMEGVPTAYDHRVREEFRPFTEKHGYDIAVEAYGGPSTGGGPEVVFDGAVHLVGLGISAVSTVVNLAAFAVLVRDGLRHADKVFGRRSAITEGSAIVLAAEAIYQATGEEDLTVAFVTPMVKFGPDINEMDVGFDGHLVAFRSRTRIYTAHVDLYGEVTLANEAEVKW